MQNESSNFLKMNLQFFAEEQESSATSDGTENTATGVENKDTSAGQQSKQSKEDNFIPKSRFDEVNSKFKDVQKQLDQLLSEKSEQEKKAAEQRGEYEKLYKTAEEQLTTFKSQYEQTDARAKSLEGIITEMLDNRLKAIPEDLHELIPDGLTPEQRLAWIDKAERKGVFNTAKKSEQPVGEGTNPANNQAGADLTNMNPFQLLKAGYGRK
jgi:chromosome segregation ATPase